MGLNVFGKIHTCGTTDWHGLVVRRHIANDWFHCPLKSATPEVSHLCFCPVAQQKFDVLHVENTLCEEQWAGESFHGKEEAFFYARITRCRWFACSLTLVKDFVNVPRF